MDRPKDHIGEALHECLKVLKSMHTLGGGMSSDSELEALIKKVEVVLRFWEQP